MQDAGVRLITQAKVGRRPRSRAGRPRGHRQAQAGSSSPIGFGKQAYFSKRFVRPLYDRAMPSRAQAKRLARRAGADPGGPHVP